MTRRELLWVIGLCSCLCLLALALFHVYLVDDAYITFRAARNLADGHGFVFNRGERVEAWSNSLWALVLALVAVLTSRLDAVAPYLGAAFGVLALVDTYRVFRLIGILRLPAVAALIILGITPQYWLVVANGLEGGLFSFLLARTLYSFMAPTRKVVTGVWGGLMSLTRPEACAFLPVFLAFSLCARGDSEGTVRSRIVTKALPMLLSWGGIIAASAILRSAYYGDYLPNSVAAKYVPLSARIYGHLMAAYLAKLTLEYVCGFIIRLPHLAVAPLCALVLDRRNFAVRLSSCLMLIILLVIARNGGDWMPNQRLFMYYLPLIGISLAVSLARLHGAPPARLRGFASPFAVIVATVCVAFGVVLMTAPGSDRIRSRPDAAALRDLQWGTIAEMLKPVLSDKDTAAPEALGLFAYTLPSIRIHDFQGLADRHIARSGTRYHPRFGKSDYAYSVDMAPAVFVFHAASYHVPLLEQDSHGTFGRRYSGFSLGGAAAGFHVFIRNDEVRRILPALTPLTPRDWGECRE
jgi:arabinofuranosyltransferase